MMTTGYRVAVWFGVVVARWSQSMELAYSTPGPLSNVMGDRSGVQLPVQETYLSI